MTEVWKLLLSGWFRTIFLTAKKWWRIFSGEWLLLPLYGIFSLASYYTIKQIKVGFVVETFLHLNDTMPFLGKCSLPCWHNNCLFLPVSWFNPSQQLSTTELLAPNKLLWRNLTPSWPKPVHPCASSLCIQYTNNYTIFNKQRNKYICWFKNSSCIVYVVSLSYKSVFSFWPYGLSTWQLAYCFIKDCNSTFVITLII